MDTVVKEMLEEEESERRGLMLFGRDLSQVPCLRDSYMYGILSGIGVGFAAFIRTSKPQTSTHIGMGGFVLSTMFYWTYCRYQWSKQRFDAELLQAALKEKMLLEGTEKEKRLQEQGVLKTV